MKNKGWLQRQTSSAIRELNSSPGWVSSARSAGRETTVGRSQSGTVSRSSTSGQLLEPGNSTRKR